MLHLTARPRRHRTVFPERSFDSYH